MADNHGLDAPAAADPPETGADDPVTARIRQAALVVTALLAVSAVGIWLTPFTVSGNKGFPFGCGSAAHPNATALGRQVCDSAVSARSLLVLFLIGAAVLCGLAVGLLPARWIRHVPGPLCAVPLLAVAAYLLFAPMVARGVDGSSVECGNAVSPHRDPFALGLCADLPGNRLGTGLTIVALAVVLGAGVSYAGGARRSRDLARVKEPVRPAGEPAGAPPVS